MNIFKLGDMKGFFLIFSAILILFSLTKCKNTRKTTINQQQELDSLVSMYHAINDSIDFAWDEMIRDDDEKVLFMKRLLLEVSYTNSYDKIRFDTLNKYIDHLKTMRYNRVSMVDSKLIDEYDSATSSVSAAVIDFAIRHPAYDNSHLMKELVNDIYDKNGMVLIYRIHYDGFVKDREHFIKKNRKKLLKALGQHDLEKLPVFALPS